MDAIDAAGRAEGASPPAPPPAPQPPPQLLQLPVQSPAARRLLTHLSRTDVRAFALSCKHARLLALGAISTLALGGAWLAARHQGGGRAVAGCGAAAFPSVTCVALRPRTAEELSKLCAELLLGKWARRLPSLASLRLDMQCVFDRQLDVSLTIRAIGLHCTGQQLTSLLVHQSAALTPGVVGALAGMPLLAALTLKHSRGVAPGALAGLARLAALTALHLEAAPSSSSSSSSDGLAVAPSHTVAAADEAGLASCTRLANLALLHLGPPAARPLEALLGALAAPTTQPSLTRLLLQGLPLPVPPGALLAALAATTGLQELSLGGDVAVTAAELGGLSSLAALTSLQLPAAAAPAAGLASLGRSCSQLACLTLVHAGGAAPSLTPAMPGVSRLQLLASGSSAPGCQPVVLQLAGPGWPGLRALDLSGLALDATGVASLRRVTAITSLSLAGGDGAVLHAPLLLPLLELPVLRHLVLLDLTGLCDEWLADALRGLAPLGSSSCLAALQELHLGAAASAPAGVTDRGLVRLFAVPQLRKLALTRLPAITLAGVKALVRGSTSLAVLELRACAGVSAAPPDAVARAAVPTPDRAVDLWVFK